MRVLDDAQSAGLERLQEAMLAVPAVATYVAATGAFQVCGARRVSHGVVCHLGLTRRSARGHDIVPDRLDPTVRVRDEVVWPFGRPMAHASASVPNSPSVPHDGDKDGNQKRDNTMTRYEITPADAGLAIQISGVGDRRDVLLAAFGECQKGQCSCPTDEYQKVEAMDIAQSEDAIEIRLRAKPGTEFDSREIAACLDYTVTKVGE